MSVTQADRLIQQGFMVMEADDSSIHEDWKLPVELRITHDKLHQDLMRVYDDYLDVDNYRDRLPNILQEYEIVMTRYRNTLKRIESHVANNLPEWRYDSRLLDYGFEPRHSAGLVSFASA